MKLSLSGLGQPVRTKGKYQLFFDCPLCSDTRGRLGVHVGKQVFHCFNCNQSGRIDELKKPLDNFQERVKAYLEGNDEEEKEVSKLQLPESWERICHKSGMPYRYLVKRQVSDGEIKKYGIGYCSNGEYAERIIIPIYNEERSLSYYVGRAYTNRTPKYLNAKVPKETIIFKTFQGRAKQAIICEGIFDAIRIGKLYPAIAILGKIISTYGQLQEIVKSTGKAYIMLDKDAQKDGFVAAQTLNYFIPTQLMLLEKDKDPGSMELHELKRILPK